MTNPSTLGMPSIDRVYGLRLLREPRFRRVILASVLGLALMVRGAQLLVYSTQIQWGYDFSAYWAAAARVLDGLPIYTAQQLTGPYSPQQQYLYLYPPSFAVAMTPFAAIFGEYRIANWAWAAIGATLAAIVAVLVDRRAFITRGRDRWLLVGAVFAFPPVVGELVMGNVHLLILGLLGVAWYLLDRSGRGDRQDAMAGVLIGIASVIKIFPVVMVLWLVLQRRWTALTWSIVAMAGCVLVTLPVVGLQPWLQYPTVLANLAAPVDVTDTIAPTVWLSSIVSTTVARAIVIIAGLAAISWSSGHRLPAVSYAVAVAVSVLVAPAMYQHYMALMVLPLLLALRWARPVWWVAVAYLLMFGGEQEALGGIVWVVNRVLPTIGALLVVVGLMWRGSTSDAAVLAPSGAR